MSSPCVPLAALILVLLAAAAFGPLVGGAVALSVLVGVVRGAA
jgi:uncharacterized membrane protein YdjX (TVP38/TMEM64 family)